ncbi:putative ABC transport system permease protein [Pseudarcicella hirudinis]|uniref:Putative ABC transport system permease protein n=1 Tax=Pseudarcicella hirudinis TaxID=1079859 RepID=A0A1I5XA25_9BACT|nr:ABC transporter permease [Pseudarcicella hirudinis]SFQ28825.1 putative ABC transport system permease protein [Pseudarcicella hirudinis]
MIRNYFKIALRNLLRNKVYGFINIVGLAMGIAAFLLILEYVSLEKSVNQFHTNLPEMYRVLCQNPQGENWPQIEPGWMNQTKDLPEIKGYSRFAEGIAQGIVKNDEKNISFREQQIGYAEGNFFDFFSFPLKSGNPESLANPSVVFLSESYAKKYFGNENPIGKTLGLHNQFGHKLYTVEGVYADMGENSDINFDMLFSLETLRNPANLNGNDWANLDNLDSQYINAFLLLDKNADFQALEKKLTKLRRSLQVEKDAIVFKIQPFSSTHLATSFSDPLQHTGNVKYIYMLAGIAFLILIIAWFNYINLSTANALKKANEVGVRKVIGATQANLIGQFLSESLLVNLLAFGLATFLVMLLQPFFNDLIGKNLSILTLSGSSVWIYGLCLLTTGSFLSGIYTASALSNFKPVDTLKGKITKTIKGVLLRKSLVVSQFSISIALILFTILIYAQLQYMQKQDLGMDINQLLVIQGPELGKDSSFKDRRNGFWNEVAKESYISDYSTSGSIPGKWYNFNTGGFTSAKSKAGDEQKSYAFAIVGDRYLKTYGIKIKTGRNFTPQECDVDWNNNSKVMLNERAVKELGFNSAEEAVRSKIKWDERYLEIIGVVKDYHHTGLQKTIDPIIFYPQNNGKYITIRLNSEKMQEKIASLEKLYKTFFPGNPFEYFFVDDNFNKQYLNEKQYSSLFTTASVWAIVIACLGLFGLATFTVESRTKEIGIRKVLGASVMNITGLLSKDFLILVGIALLISSPLAYYFMNKWLTDFAYRVEISWLIFVLAGTIAVLIALITISYQAIRAALMNPVKSLRTE